MMDGFQSLLERDEDVRRGAVFRFPAKWPYEAQVDYLLVEMPDEDDIYKLIVSTGYKAGLVALVLPLESYSEDGTGISISWLKKNWNYWVYSDCSVDQVEVIDNYELA